LAINYLINAEGINTKHCTILSQ